MMAQVGANWLRLPEELKVRDQWCVAGPDKAPYVAGSNGLHNASPTKGPWLSFNEASQIAQYYNVNIGYVLTKDDPFTCIDLDVKDVNSVDAKGKPLPEKLWTKPEELDVYLRVVSQFETYTEMSSGGQGLHLWLYGNIGAGYRRSHAEIYSQERFIICTGNHIENPKYSIVDKQVILNGTFGYFKPIASRPELLETIVDEMKRASPKVALVELSETISDKELLERASTARNAEKFNDLCNGNWEKYNYPSQSEADFSLLSMFTFYSQSNAQCRRLFRLSGLAREKTNKSDYHLNKALQHIRARQEREAMVEINLDEQARQLVKEMQEQVAVKEEDIIKFKNNELPDVEGLPWPPGLAGQLASFIYQSAPRPVKEVAIVAAIGLLAGIVGKAFHFNQSGLNVYLILVARSAIGKEAMHSGVSLILDKIRNSIPGCQDFVDFNEFASGPALMKKCASTTSFVNIAGEWGRKFKRLSSEDGREGPMQQLRTVMTNLYQKSGPSSIVGGLSYSNKEQNVGPVSGVAYSMIGETTPGTFYESLTDSMMEDGFLSRFTVIEFTGDRPHANKNPVLTPNENLTEAMCRLVTQSLTLLSRFQHIELLYNPEAKDILDKFDHECDNQINSTSDEGWRQMWNRAHLKAIRISGILAVGDNCVTPRIEVHHVQWALDVVRRDIGIMSRRISEGDVGTGDPAREKKLIYIIRKYCEEPVAKSYKIPEQMRINGIVPRRFLQVRSNRVTAFSSHKGGSTQALDTAIKSLVDSGYIMECDKTKVAEEYGAQGRCFRVISLPHYEN